MGRYTGTWLAIPGEANRPHLFALDEAIRMVVHLFGFRTKPPKQTVPTLGRFKRTLRL